MMASIKPRSSITAASVTYMTPIRLWSTLVIHSRHRYGTQPLSVMKATPPTSTRTTKAPAARGIGWPRGRASQFSFPSMLIPPPNAQLRSGRHDESGVSLGDRARSGRERLIEDPFEQPLRNRLEGERLRHDALLRQLFIAVR